MTHFYIERAKNAVNVFGLWLPPENYGIPYFILRSVVLLVEYSFLLFNLMYMVQVWGDIEEASQGSYLLFTQATLCLKATNFLVKKNRLIRLLSCMESDIFACQTPVHEKIVSGQALKMWKLYIFFLSCATANCIEWAVVPLLENHKARVFPFKLWMPVDPATSPNLDYYLCYTYQILAIYMSACAYLTIDYFTVSMIAYATAQLEIIGEKIKEIPPVALSTGLNAEDKRSLLEHNNETMNECIKQHQAVMRFVGLVENMFNVNIFFQLSGTVAIICIIGIHITTEPPDSMQFYSTLNYLVTMLAQLYLYCWCGNELTDRSEVLRNLLYTSTWYEQDQRFRKTLAIAMECMKRPIIFRAGYYIPLSRPTFVSILRCSYSYFAVLNQANNK